ncbi:MAG: hypothetical protein R3E87_14350 [Burkholderiaceae bacterium]
MNPISQPWWLATDLIQLLVEAILGAPGRACLLLCAVITFGLALLVVLSALAWPLIRGLRSLGASGARLR